MRVGVIGCGNISTAYFELSKLFNFIEIVACADIDRGAAKKQAEAFNLKACSIEALLAADDVDIVVNLTIPAAHFDVTRSIVLAGKHAYSEKPFALTVEEGKALKSLCAERGVQIGSAPDTFLGGAHQLARAHLDSGAVGKITSGTAVVMSHGMEHWHPNPDFFFQKGGGPILDIGPYYVTNLINLLGPVARVSALSGMASQTRTIMSEPRKGEEIPVETPTTIHALLEFHSGAIISLMNSWDVWAHTHSNMELYGTNGSLYVPDPNFFGGEVRAGGGDFGEMATLDGGAHPFGVPNQDHGNGRMANYRTAGLADMARGIETDAPYRCSLDLALHAVDVMTSVLKAGETREVVELTTSCVRPEAMTAADAASLLKA